MPAKSSCTAKSASAFEAIQQVDFEQSVENEKLAAIRIFRCSSDSTLDRLSASFISLLKEHTRQKNIGIVSSSKWASTILFCHPEDIKLDPGFVEELLILNPDLVVAVVETLPHDQFQCPADEEGRFLSYSRSILDILSSNLGKGLCLISSSTDESGLQDLIEPIISLAINKHDELEKKLASSILSKLLDSDHSGSLDPIDTLFLAEIGHQIGLSLGISGDTGRESKETIREKLLASAEQLTRQEISCFLDSPGVSESPLQVEDLFSLQRFARVRRAIIETRSILKGYHGIDQDKLDDRVFFPILDMMPPRIVLIDANSMDLGASNSSIQTVENVGSFFSLVEIGEGFTLWMDDLKKSQIAVEFSDRASLLPYVKTGTRLPYGDIITDQDEAIRLVSSPQKSIPINLPGETVFDHIPAEFAPGMNLSEVAAEGALVLMLFDRYDQVGCSLAKHSCPSVSFEPSSQRSEDSPGTHQCYQLSGAGKTWSDKGSFSGAINGCLNKVQAHLAGVLQDEESFREELVPRKELNNLNEVKENLRELERNFKEQVEHGRGKLLETITDWERAKDEIKEVNELIESAPKDTASIDAKLEPSEKDMESMPIVREFWREFPFVKSLFIATRTLVEAFEAKTKTSRESMIEWLATSKTSREKITEYLSADLDCRSSHRISLGLVEEAIADLQTCCDVINGQKWLKRLVAEKISHYSDHVPCMRISHSTLKRVVRLLSEQRSAVEHLEDSEKSVHQSYKEYIEKSESLNRRLREIQAAFITSATSQGFSPIRLHELERVEDSMAHFESWKERFGKTLDDRLSYLRVMIDRTEEEHLCRTRDLYHCLKHLRNRIALYEGSIEYDETESSRSDYTRTEPATC